MSKVWVIDHDRQYEKMFIEEGWQIVNSILDEPDLIQFTGGEDVSPVLYGEENTCSSCNFARDMHEAGIFAVALRMNIPMAGICRGGQFLNVMCGGEMEQDVPNHCGSHMAFVYDTGEEVLVSSTHHQMMIVGPDSFLLLGASEYTDCMEVEAVVYSNQRVLCFQPHPEFSEYSECRKLYFQFIREELDIGD